LQFLAVCLSLVLQWGSSWLGQAIYLQLIYLPIIFHNETHNWFIKNMKSSTDEMESFGKSSYIDAIVLTTTLTHGQRLNKNYDSTSPNVIRIRCPKEQAKRF
jgi:hypothetical protein